MTDENASAEAVVAAPLTDGERLHPLGLFVSFITGLPQLFFPLAAALLGTRDSNIGTPIIFGGVLLISLLFRWLSWLRFRFHLDEDDIRIERGILNRTVRSIPYDRIQDVSIEEKPLARLLGLGEVKFETGGGEGEDAKLSFVGMDRAKALRETIRARKVESANVAHVEQAEAEGQTVFAMDNRRVLTLGLYSFSLIIFAILGGAAQQFDFLLPFDFWDFKDWIGMAKDRGVSIDAISMNARIIGAVFALLALIALGLASGIIRTVLNEYGFRLERNERGFRRRRGLLTKTDVVMAVNRVQAANIVTGPIRKRRGWHALKFVSLAQDSKQESDMMVAPLAKLDEIWPIAAEAGIAPPAADAAFRKSRFIWWAIGAIIVLALVLTAMVAVILFADSSVAKSLLLLLIPAAFLVSSWLEWRHYGDHFDAQQLYVREGWWKQKFTIGTQVKVQSAEISQGPIARMLGLSTLHFGIAGGTLSFSALPLDQARAIRDQVVAVAAPIDFSELNRTD